MVMGVSLLVILVPFFIEKRQSIHAADASMNIRSLYQNQVVSYFSGKRFRYSLTRISTWPDFFSARPPQGKPEKLVGYSGRYTDKNGKSVVDPLFVDWNSVGFRLDKESYFIYRVEPAVQFHGKALIGAATRLPLHFQALAIGDTDGDRRYSVLLRGGYVDKDNIFRGMDVTYVGDLTE